MKRRWWIVAGLMIAILATGFFVNHSHRDPYAPLRRYMVIEQTTFVRPMAGRPGMGIIFRMITLRDAPPKLLHDTLLSATSGRGWVREPDNPIGALMYWAHKGASKDVYANPIIEVQERFVQRQSASYVDPRTVDLVDAHPVTWWELLWVNTRYLGHEHLTKTVYQADLHQQ